MNTQDAEQYQKDINKAVDCFEYTDSDAYDEIENCGEHFKEVLKTLVEDDDLIHLIVSKMAKIQVRKARPATIPAVNNMNTKMYEICCDLEFMYEAIEDRVLEKMKGE
jgi:hypothetical protein